MMASPPPRVCVTGGGGFVASWLVKLLLSRGYAVHATVRDPGDPKNAFLKQLEMASENLRIFKADVLDYDTLTAAFAGCEGVFHPASPVPGDKMEDPEKEVLAPTVEGTTNVVKACSATKVQKLVAVSSVAASCFDPKWPQDKLKDEGCWTDKQLCKETKVRDTGPDHICNLKQLMGSPKWQLPKKRRSTLETKSFVNKHSLQVKFMVQTDPTYFYRNRHV